VKVLRTVLWSSVLLLTLLGVSGGAAGPQCADQSPRYINPKANPSP
jgi:hypothetical protein